MNPEPKKLEHAANNAGSVSNLLRKLTLKRKKKKEKDASSTNTVSYQPTETTNTAEEEEIIITPVENGYFTNVPKSEDYTERSVNSIFSATWTKTSEVKRKEKTERRKSLHIDGKNRSNDDDKQNEDIEAYIIEHFKILQHVIRPPCIKNSLECLMNNSENFPIPFPVETIRCKKLNTQQYLHKDLLEYCIDFTYPLLHESVLQLYIEFLEHKMIYGTPEERSLYSRMDITDLVQRILEKKAAYFIGSDDKYLLLDGTQGEGGWGSVESASENETLNIYKCLSYDEMKLSAFLSVSSYSCFINDGSRNNKGVMSSSRKYVQTYGVVVSLTGARFEKPGFMDWQEIVISREQNTGKNGYGPLRSKRNDVQSWRSIWSKLYNLDYNFPLFIEASQGGKYCKIEDMFFNNESYIRRLQISIETLLIEAQSRGKKARKQAYIHVVGIGLGVWMISPHQEKIFLDAFALSIQKLISFLSYVSDIDFSWFKESSCGGVTSGQYFTAEGTTNKIKIYFSKRNPHDRLPEKDDAKLLIVSYPGDGNALPGNEFWGGALSSSGNTAEAASSQIAELHNPHINPMVCGANLHVATADWGVIHISSYARRILDAL